MAFAPIGPSASTALSGTLLSPRFLEIGTSDIDEISPLERLYERRIHETKNNPKSIEYTIYIIIISAFIFISIIAIFDVIRNVISNYYAEKTLNDPKINNTKEDIERAEIANQNALWSSIVFAAIAFVIGVIGTFIISEYLL